MTLRILLAFASLVFGPVLMHGASFVLTWNDNSTNETGFTVERAPGLTPDPSAFQPIANVVANATTYTDASLPPSTDFSYRVCAYNSSGKSAYSNTASGTTLPPPPDAPGKLNANPPPAYVPPTPVVTLQPGESLQVVAAVP